MFSVRLDVAKIDLLFNLINTRQNVGLMNCKTLGKYCSGTQYTNRFLINLTVHEYMIPN